MSPKKTKISTRIDHSIWNHLHQLNQLMSRVIDRELSPSGLNHSQARLLNYLTKISNDNTLATLARVSRQNPAAISSVVTRMEKQQLLKREKLDSSNKIYISITEKGEKALNKAKKIKSIERILSCLSPNEKNQILGLLKELLYGVHQELADSYRRSYLENVGKGKTSSSMRKHNIL